VAIQRGGQLVYAALDLLCINCRESELLTRHASLCRACSGQRNYLHVALRRCLCCDSVIDGRVPDDIYEQVSALQ
jgi:hypothetical protein